MRAGSGPQLVKTFRLSQLRRQPAAVSLRLPVQASRLPARSSTRLGDAHRPVAAGGEPRTATLLYARQRSVHLPHPHTPERDRRTLGGDSRPCPTSFRSSGLSSTRSSPPPPVRRLADVRRADFDDGDGWTARLADARALPESDGTYSAVITSPPYPNRHDYTRVFGVELMFGFLDWERNRELRRQSFHSHPEARPRRPQAPEYEAPGRLEDSVRDLSDQRIRRMLRGYFLDMYLCLREAARVCRDGAKIAFVVGNARYGGRAILVDEFTAELGERAGLVCKEIRAVRWRGNSAQQMGRYGRVASRESIVIFEKPSRRARGAAVAACCSVLPAAPDYPPSLRQNRS